MKTITSERINYTYDSQTLVEAFQSTTKREPDRLSLRTPGGVQKFTWSDYKKRVESIASGLYALGVRRGDAVGLMMANRPEFNLCDTAIMHLGAIGFSIYNTSSAEQIEHIFNNARNSVVIVEEVFLKKISALKDRTSLSTIICLESKLEGLITLEKIENMSAHDFDFEQSWRSVQADDIATIIYTSGTTGPSKGVELTHRNLLSQINMANSVLPAKFGDRVASYLPHAHIADRWLAHYAHMVIGLEVTSIPDPKAIGAALPDFRPNVWGGVPRIWEKLKSALETQGILDPKGLTDDQKRNILEKMGLNEVRWTVSGAAPIPVTVLEYFNDLGLPISELWGMSELSCCAIVNPLNDIRPGTVGKALPGIDLKLGGDNELFVKSPTIMRGYRGMPEQTKETIDEDGWLATGDIASIDDNGYVRIVDRKKEIIINAAGKNMSPSNIENTLKSSSPLIGQAVVIGDARPYNVALIVLDPDYTASFASSLGLSDGSVCAMSKEPNALKEIDSAIASANDRMSRVEQIKRYFVLSCDWEPGGYELTPTAKLKRKAIYEKYEDIISSLYA